LLDFERGVGFVVGHLGGGVRNPVQAAAGPSNSVAPGIDW
jgi:hypothetical protein